MRNLTLALTGLFCLSAFGQIRGPVQGYVVDREARAIRPVNGIPGASFLGDPLDCGIAVDLAAINGARAVALAADTEQNRTAFITGLDATPSSNILEGTLANPVIMVLSPSVRTAAIAGAEGTLQRITIGTDSAPRVEAPIVTDTASAVTALAIDDTGNILYASGDGIYAVPAGSSASALVTRVQSVSALVTKAQGFFYADNTANEVVAARWESGAVALTVIAQERDGVQGPVGLDVSADGKRLYVANKDSATLLVWNLEFGARETELELASPPTRCQRLGADGVLALNEGASVPLLLLDPGTTPRVVFVPAVAKN
jgi:hypothetical protein